MEIWRPHCSIFMHRVPRNRFSGRCYCGSFLIVVLAVVYVITLANMQGIICDDGDEGRS